MNLQLCPQLQRFVDEQVETGQFASPDDVIESALARLMLDPVPEKLDEQDIADLRTSLDQMRRGEVLDWKQAPRR